MRIFLRGFRVFISSQPFIFMLMALFSWEAWSQNKTTMRDSLKQLPDTLTFSTGDSISSIEKHRRKKNYFDQTFTLSKSPNNVYVGIKKEKYALSPDANAGDFLNKIPTIYKLDGTYYVQGRELNSMLMNFYSLFGNNYNAITIFPEKMFQSAHIYEDQSFSMLWSGILDGNSNHAIDLITDVNYSENSWAGRFYGGWGITDMWDAGAVFSYFDKNRALNFVAQSNNVNKQWYTPLDLSGMVASSNLNNFSFRDPNPETNYHNLADDVNFRHIDQFNGINRDFSTGVRYFDTYKNIKYYFNYYYSYTDNDTQTDFDRFYSDTDNDAPQYSEQTLQHSVNKAHRINGRLYYYMGSHALLRITPTVYIQNLNGEMDLSGIYQTPYSAVSSSGNTLFDGSYTHVNFEFGYHFKKPGRSFFASVAPRYNTRKNNYAAQLFFQPAAADSLLEQSVINIEEFSINAGTSYVEPIGKQGFLKLSYQYDYTADGFDKQSTYSDASIFYPHLLDSASMLQYKTDNMFSAHTFELIYQYNAHQWILNFGVEVAATSVLQKIPDSTVQSKKTAKIYPLPVFNFIYSFDDFRMLKIEVQAQSAAPNLLDMQETFLMKNPLNAVYGNAKLAYTVNNVFDLRFTRLNQKNSGYLFFHLGAMYSAHYIGNDMISDYERFYNPNIISNSIVIIVPENLKNYVSATPYFHNTFPLPRIKSTFDIDIFGKFSHIPTIANGIEGFSNQFRAGGGLALKSGIDDRIDFMLSSYSTYNYNLNTWNPDEVTQYAYQRTLINIATTPFKRRILIQTDISHNYAWGSYNSYDDISKDGFFLWNASIGVKFTKDRSLTLKCAVHDILNQNKNILQYSSSVYSEQLITNNLKRYYMISLTYDLNKFGTSNAADPAGIMP